MLSKKTTCKVLRCRCFAGYQEIIINNEGVGLFRIDLETLAQFCNLGLIISVPEMTTDEARPW